MKLIVQKNFMFLSFRDSNLPKKAYNLKKEVKKIHLNININKECSKNYVYFIVESNNHYNKMNIIFPTSP